MPSVTVWPPSRYSRASISGGRAVNQSGSCSRPCSSTTTRAPPSASSAATHRAAGAGADHAHVGARRARAASRPSLRAPQLTPAGDDRLGVPAERARRAPGRRSAPSRAGCCAAHRRAAAGPAARARAGGGPSLEQQLQARAAAARVRPRRTRARALIRRSSIRRSCASASAAIALAAPSRVARAGSPRRSRVQRRELRARATIARERTALGRYSSRTEFMISWKRGCPPPEHGGHERPVDQQRRLLRRPASANARGQLAEPLACSSVRRCAASRPPRPAAAAAPRTARRSVLLDRLQRRQAPRARRSDRQSSTRVASPWRTSTSRSCSRRFSASRTEAMLTSNSAASVRCAGSRSPGA